MEAIQTRELAKTYNLGTANAVPALSPLDLTVKQGEIFGLLGPNGAGKTTLIKLLLGIIYPTSGEAFLLGNKIPSVKAKREIGYLPESHRYPLYLSGQQTLEFYGNLAEISGDTLKSTIDELLELVSLTKWRNMKIKKYSKGMMQRLGLAQALLNKPKLLFLDEPTDGVDPIGRKEIRDILMRVKGEGTTIFLNSHLLSEVELIADRIAFMNKGEILKIGSTKELTESQDMYQIGISGGNVQSLDKIGKFDEKEQVLEVFARSLEDLNVALDSIRKDGGLIRSIAPKRSSLEDLFFTLIGKKEA